MKKTAVRLRWTMARSTRTTEEPGKWLVAAAVAGAIVMAQQGGGSAGLGRSTVAGAGAAVAQGTGVRGC